MGARHGGQHGVFRTVGVLHFVHLDPAVAAAPAFQHVGVPLEQQVDADNQVGEVYRMVFSKTGDVVFDDGGELEVLAPVQRLKVGIVEQCLKIILRFLTDSFVVEAQAIFPGRLKQQRVEAVDIFAGYRDAAGRATTLPLICQPSSSS